MSEALQKKLIKYTPTKSTIDLIKNTKILLLVGPSGAGKDALKDELVKTSKYHHLVSHTTRAPRINKGKLEQNGKEYHFISETQAEQMLDNKEFVEAKIYNNHIYGTSVSEIQKANKDGKIAMTDIEVQGVKEYISIDPNVKAVFLLPPNFSVWLVRLIKRYGKSIDEKDLNKRFRIALSELNEMLKNSFYKAVVNDDLNKALSLVDKIASSNDFTYSDLSDRTVALGLVADIEKYLA
ncbi:MAG TPA: hypothetical protein VLF63_00915 [Patescibacteria group bacterium]|nr:hypothetical protein [Patescibacteria group bacterium]